MKLDYFGHELEVDDYVVLRSPGSSSHRLILGRIAKFTEQFVTISHAPVDVWSKRHSNRVASTKISSKHCVKVSAEQALVRVLSD